MDLVTGAFGFVGTHLVRELLAAGREVVAADLPAAIADPARRALVERLGVDLAAPRLHVIPADLLDAASLDGLLTRPIARVFHTASLYDYSAPLDRLRRVNVEGTRTLLARLAGRPLERFVHWSTCGVFGKPYPASTGARNNLPFTEASSSPKTAAPGATGPAGTHLVNAYSVSKWEQEQLVWRAQREAGLPLTVLRPAPVYGPGSRYGHGGIILAVARGYVRAMPRDARHYVTASVHVEDVARFAAFIADRPAAVGEDYNVVDDSVISYREFLDAIALLVGRRIREVPFVTMPMLRPGLIRLARLWTWLERRHGVPRWRILEEQSATYVASSYWIANRKSLATGFTYRYADVREGLKDTIAWMRDAGWL